MHDAAGRVEPEPGFCVAESLEFQKLKVSEFQQRKKLALQKRKISKARQRKKCGNLTAMILTCASFKGGVGKTTSAVHFAAYLRPLRWPVSRKQLSVMARLLAFSVKF